MKIVYNDPFLKQRRRELRKDMTHSERMLWERLRGRRFKGLRFLRQYSVGPYILDFYCPSQRLAIELDGADHATRRGISRDEIRDEYLQDQGIRILRFWNIDLDFKIDEVLERISNASLGHKGGKEGSFG